MSMLPKLMVPVLRVTSPLVVFAVTESRLVTDKVVAPATWVTLPVGVVNVRLPTLLVPNCVPPVLSVIVTSPPVSRSSPKKLPGLLSEM